MGRYRSLPKAVCLRLLDSLRSFPDELSVVCIAKYEAPYIEEWVRYHLCQGVDRIYVYDNDSPDETVQILRPFVEAGKVVCIPMPGRGRQLDAYNDAVRRFGAVTRYMAFLDVDEFLVQEDPEISLKDTIRALFRKKYFCGGLGVNWRVYGSSGLERKPEGYVIEHFRRRGSGTSEGSECIKTIANPRLIQTVAHVHYPAYLGGLRNINELGQPLEGWSNPAAQLHHIRINHYFTKSREEWILRRSRGKADTLDETDKRTMEEFDAHDCNEVLDEILLPYVEKIKAYECDHN